MRYVTLAHYPDYYTNLEGAMQGHRSMEPEALPADQLGEEWRRLRHTHPVMHLGGGIGITQVVHQEGHLIEGLYAIGNCSALTLPCYPGPGSTLGPAMTFAYQAAKSISGYRD